MVAQTALQGLASIWAGAGLTLLVITPLALLAGVGRGYLAPLGFTMLALVLAQIVAATGHGAYFPWAIPALLTDVAGSQGGDLVPDQLRHRRPDRRRRVVATVAWWRYADFSR